MLKQTFVVSAKPETLQVCTFSKSRGHHDQLVMKGPRKLKEDVSYKFPYKFPLKRKQTRTIWKVHTTLNPQIAIVGTKHTNTTDKNKILHKKLISKLLKSTIQNPQ